MSTHILVPNKEYYRNLLILKNDPDSEAIEVDLSEEGITTKANTYPAVYNSFAAGYLQCAKDLLNNK